MKRLVACLSLVSFCHSFIFHETLLAVSASLKEHAETRLLERALERHVIPSRYGRVAHGRLSGEENLVVYIQDLHCNPEVQRNIAHTLKIIDARYGINRIFVEGAPAGKLDLRMFTSLEDEAVRSSAVETLAEKGLLSGPEYYALKNKKDKLYGLEDWNVYTENLERYRNALAAKEINLVAAERLGKLVERLHDTHLSQKLKKMEKVFNGSRGENRYLRIEKLGDRAGITVSAFPNLARYLSIIKLTRDIRHKRLNGQLKDLTGEIKQLVPARVYLALAEKLKQSDTTEEYYRSLSAAAREYRINVARRYPEADKFFRYLDLNVRINPLSMVEEEAIFMDRVLSASADRLLDKEILFMAGMSRHFRNFVELKMSPADYRYFKENKDRFNVMLQKYFHYNDVRDVVRLLDAGELHLFYWVNFKRNDIFIGSVADVARGFTARSAAGETHYRDRSYEKVLERMGDFGSIDVIVAGGFHLDIARLLRERGASYLVITPNASDTPDERLYEQVIRGTIDLQEILGSAISEIKIGSGLDPNQNFAAIGTVIVAAVRANALRAEPLLNRNVAQQVNEWIDANETLKGFRVEYVGGQWKVSFTGETGVTTYAIEIDKDKGKVTVKAPAGTRRAEAQQGLFLSRGRVGMLNKRFTAVARAITDQQSVQAALRLLDDNLPLPGLSSLFDLSLKGSRFVMPIAGGSGADSDAASLAVRISKAASDILGLGRPATIPELLTTLRFLMGRDTEGKPYFSREVVDFLTAYARDVEQRNPQSRVELYWPLLKAVVQLTKEEEEALMQTLRDEYSGRRRPTLMDALLLMASPDDDQGLREWIKTQAPHMVDRRIYFIAAEISHWSGGLGPVMKFHSLGMKLLGANVECVEPWYLHRNAEEEELDYTKFEEDLRIENIRVIDTFAIEMDGKKVMVEVGHGKDRAGIDHYLIRDVQPGGAMPYYTRMLYNYGDTRISKKTGQPINPVTWEEFAAFYTKATVEFIKRRETAHIEKEGAEWKAPVIHGNDGQVAPLFPIYKSLEIDKYLFQVYRQAVARLAPGAKLQRQKPLRQETTHTIFNRGFGGFADIERVLARMMGVTKRFISMFIRYGDDGSPYVDYTAGGLAGSHAQSGVSDDHIAVVKRFNRWVLNMVGITNGAVPAMMGKVFRTKLQELFGAKVDLDRPTAEQIQAAKIKTAEHLNEREIKTANGYILKVDPLRERPGMGYIRRLVDEKDGLKRAFYEPVFTWKIPQRVVVLQDEDDGDRLLRKPHDGSVYRPAAEGGDGITKGNIWKLIEMGYDLVLVGAVQGSAQSKETAKKLEWLEKEIHEAKERGELPPNAGTFAFIPAYTPEQKMAILAWMNIQVQDSDPNTGACEFTEEDIDANGGYNAGHPGDPGRNRELGRKGGVGIIGAQGIEVDWDRSLSGQEEMVGQTIMPDEPTPEGYLNEFAKAMKLWQENRRGFFANAALSVRLARVMNYKLASAAYLRKYEEELVRWEEEATQDAAFINAVIEDLSGRQDSYFVANDILVRGRGKVKSSFGFTHGGRVIGAGTPGLISFLKKKNEIEEQYGFNALFHHFAARNETDFDRGDFAGYIVGLFDGLESSEAVRKWFEQLNRSPATIIEKDERFAEVFDDLVSALRELRERSVAQRDAAIARGSSGAAWESRDDSFIRNFMLPAIGNDPDVMEGLLSSGRNGVGRPFGFDVKDADGASIRRIEAGNSGISGFLTVKKAIEEEFGYEAIEQHLLGGHYAAYLNELFNGLQYSSALRDWLENLNKSPGTLYEKSIRLNRFLERLIGALEQQREAALGEQQPAAAVLRPAMSGEEASRILTSADLVPPFTFSYQNGDTPEVVTRSGAGLRGFIRGVEELSARGQRGVASLAFHAGRNGAGDPGDILSFLDNSFRKMAREFPLMEAVAEEIHRLALQAADSRDVAEKVRYTSLSFDIIRGLSVHLEIRRDTRKSAGVSREHHEKGINRGIEDFQNIVLARDVDMAGLEFVNAMREGTSLRAMVDAFRNSGRLHPDPERYARSVFTALARDVALRGEMLGYLDGLEERAARGEEITGLRSELMAFLGELVSAYDNYHAIIRGVDYSWLERTPLGRLWRQLGAVRRAGVAVPLWSIHSGESVGIGEYLDIKLLADWARRTGMTIIQLLPLNDTGANHWPYAAESSFALDPMYLRLQNIEGVDSAPFRESIGKLRRNFSFDGKTHLDYRIKDEKLVLLRKMFMSRSWEDNESFKTYRQEQRYWLRDFALFRTIKELNPGKSWEQWDSAYKERNDDALRKLEDSAEFLFQEWLQWQTYLQAKDAKAYANRSGVYLLGDIPFLAGRESADVWAHQNLFKLDKEAGAPPDQFSADGQRWGNPPYNWEAIRADNDYAYLRARLNYAAQFYDYFRIDHFIGLLRLWTIDAREPASNGGRYGSFDPADESQWYEHGKRILDIMIQTDMMPVAEDLGAVPPQAIDLLRDYGILGTDVVRWVRDYWSAEQDHLPFDRQRPNAAVTTSVHDSSNLKAHFESGEQGELQNAAEARSLHAFWKFLGLFGPAARQFTALVARQALLKVNRGRQIYAINPLLDWLSWSPLTRGHDMAAYRVNVPGTLSDGNWSMVHPFSLEQLLENPTNGELLAMNRQAGRAAEKDKVTALGSRVEDMVRAIAEALRAGTSPEFGAVGEIIEALTGNIAAQLLVLFRAGKDETDSMVLRLDEKLKQEGSSYRKVMAAIRSMKYFKERGIARLRLEVRDTPGLMPGEDMFALSILDRAAPGEATLLAQSFLMDRLLTRGPPEGMTVADFLRRLLSHEFDEFDALNTPSSPVHALFTAYLVEVAGSKDPDKDRTLDNFHDFIEYLAAIRSTDPQGIALFVFNKAHEFDDERVRAYRAAADRLAGQLPLIDYGRDALFERSLRAEGMAEEDVDVLVKDFHALHATRRIAEYRAEPADEQLQQPESFDGLLQFWADGGHAYAGKLIDLIRSDRKAFLRYKALMNSVLPESRRLLERYGIEGLIARGMPAQVVTNRLGQQKWITGIAAIESLSREIDEFNRANTMVPRLAAGGASEGRFTGSGATTLSGFRLQIPARFRIDGFKGKDVYLRILRDKRIEIYFSEEDIARIAGQEGVPLEIDYFRHLTNRFAPRFFSSWFSLLLDEKGRIRLDRDFRSKLEDLWGMELKNGTELDFIGSGDYITVLPRISGGSGETGESRGSLSRIIGEIRGSYRYIGISMGGTKLAVGLVDGNGVPLPYRVKLLWREARELGDNARARQESVKTTDNADRVIASLAEKINDVLEDGNIDKRIRLVVSVSLAGPVDNARGVAGAGFKTPNLPFDNFPFRAALEKELKERYGVSVSIQLFNDAEAALLGEHYAEDGSLRGTAGAIVIVGTGINIAADDGGTKGVIEAGHNLVWKNGHYEWLGDKTKGVHPVEVRYIGGVLDRAHIINKTGKYGRKYLEDLDSGEFSAEDLERNYAIINLSKGEQDFEDRLSGPNIRKRLQERIREARRAGSAEYSAIERAAKELRRTALPDEDVTEDPLEQAVTVAARAGDETARRFIKEIAAELGLALAAFADRYRDEGFVEHLVLVSGINENMGKGVYDEGASGDEDIYITTVRESAANGLRSLWRGKEASEANIEKIARGIVRSNVDETRELIAYRPGIKEILRNLVPMSFAGGAGFLGPSVVGETGDLDALRYYFDQGHAAAQQEKVAAGMAGLESLKEANSLRNFTLKYDDGGETKTLWDLQAPSLHMLSVAYQSMKFKGKEGAKALGYHSARGDFFKQAYEILEGIGASEEALPEAWEYIRALERNTKEAQSPEVAISSNAQLFGFFQGLVENLLYARFLRGGNRGGRGNRETFKKLLAAADSFFIDSGDGTAQLLAGYPWFTQSWSRDTFISLPGLLLATGRYGDARAVFRYFAGHRQANGLLPNLVRLDGKRERPTADGSLWFIEALNRYYDVTGDRGFVEEMLPTVNGIIAFYRHPRDRKDHRQFYLDTDSLVMVPEMSTWMDAMPETTGVPVTPRNGKPVEIQALWYNALGIAARLNAEAGDARRADEYGQLRKNVGKAVNDRFFVDDITYPYDVIEGDPHMDAVRPNAVYLLPGALSMTDGLLSETRTRTVLDVIERALLTPYGLRSLSPDDPRYRGHYPTFAPQVLKDPAYHQGTVWPFLMQPYVMAKLLLNKGKAAPEARKAADALLRYAREEGTIREVYDGDTPQTPGGPVSQAWSVAAALAIFAATELKEETGGSGETSQLAPLSLIDKAADVFLVNKALARTVEIVRQAGTGDAETVRALHAVQAALLQAQKAAESGDKEALHAAAVSAAQSLGTLPAGYREYSGEISAALVALHPRAEGSLWTRDIPRASDDSPVAIGNRLEELARGIAASIKTGVSPDFGLAGIAEAFLQRLIRINVFLTAFFLTGENKTDVFLPPLAEVFEREFASFMERMDQERKERLGGITGRRISSYRQLLEIEFGITGIGIYDTPDLIPDQDMFAIATEDTGVPGGRRLITQAAFVERLLKKGSPAGLGLLDFFDTFVLHENDEENAMNHPETLVYQMFSAYLERLAPRQERTADAFHDYIRLLARERQRGKTRFNETLAGRWSGETPERRNQFIRTANRLASQQVVIDFSREVALAKLAREKGTAPEGVERLIDGWRKDLGRIRDVRARVSTETMQVSRRAGRPRNYGELETSWLEGRLSAPIVRTRNLIERNYALFLEYKRLMEDILEKRQAIDGLRLSRDEMLARGFPGDLLDYLYRDVERDVPEREEDLGKLKAVRLEVYGLLFREQVSRGVQEAEAASGDERRDHVIAAATFIKDTFFKEEHKLDKNWKHAVSALKRLSEMDQEAVRDALKFEFTKPARSLDDYREELVKALGAEEGNRIVDDLILLARQLKSEGKTRIAVVNATFKGGGVAEMWQTAGAILAKEGIEVEWHIVYPTEQRYYDVTKRIHNAIQGKDGDFSTADLELLDSVSRENAGIIKGLFTDDRIGRVFIEDPQVIPLVKYGKEINKNVPMSWRLHIDISGIRKRNPGALRVWKRMKEYLHYLDKGDVALFQPGLAPDDLGGVPYRVFTQYPGIDILAEKNRRLSYDEMRQEIEEINRERGTKIDVTKPAIVTGSRFDYWKGLPVVIQAFNAKAALDPGVQLVVFGNYADDDPEGVAHFELLKKMTETSPYGDRIHLVTNYSGRKIGALYRLAAEHAMPYVAYSLREGYNLMVDEASAQGAAIITTDAGGLSRYENGKNAGRIQVSDIVGNIDDASLLYHLDGNGRIVFEKKLGKAREELEGRLAERIGELLRARKEQPEAYKKEYGRLARESLKMAYRYSMLSMMRNYLALAIPDGETLQGVARGIAGTPSVDAAAETVANKVRESSSPEASVALGSRVSRRVAAIRAAAAALEKPFAADLGLAGGAGTVRELSDLAILLAQFRSGENRTGQFRAALERHGVADAFDQLLGERGLSGIEVWDSKGVLPVDGEDDDVFVIATMDRADGKSVPLLHWALAEQLLRELERGGAERLFDIIGDALTHELDEHDALNTPGSAVYQLFSAYMEFVMGADKSGRTLSRTSDNFHRFIAYLTDTKAGSALVRYAEKKYGKQPSFGLMAARLKDQAQLLDYVKEAVAEKRLRDALRVPEAADRLMAVRQKYLFLAVEGSRLLLAQKEGSRKLSSSDTGIGPIPANFGALASYWMAWEHYTPFSDLRHLIERRFLLFYAYLRLMDELLPKAAYLQKAYGEKRLKEAGFSNLLLEGVPQSAGDLERLRELNGKLSAALSEEELAVAADDEGAPAFMRDWAASRRALLENHRQATRPGALEMLPADNIPLGAHIARRPRNHEQLARFWGQEGHGDITSKALLLHDSNFAAFQLYRELSGQLLEAKYRLMTEALRSVPDAAKMSDLVLFLIREKFLPPEPAMQLLQKPFFMMPATRTEFEQFVMFFRQVRSALAAMGIEPAAEIPGIETQLALLFAGEESVDEQPLARTVSQSATAAVRSLPDGGAGKTSSRLTSRLEERINGERPELAREVAKAAGGRTAVFHVSSNGRFPISRAEEDRRLGMHPVIVSYGEGGGIAAGTFAGGLDVPVNGQNVILDVYRSDEDGITYLNLVPRGYSPLTGEALARLRKTIADSGEKDIEGTLRKAVLGLSVGPLLENIIENGIISLSLENEARPWLVEVSEELRHGVGAVEERELPVRLALVVNKQDNPLPGKITRALGISDAAATAAAKVSDGKEGGTRARYLEEQLEALGFKLQGAFEKMRDEEQPGFVAPMAEVVPRASMMSVRDPERSLEARLTGTIEDIEVLLRVLARGGASGIQVDDLFETGPDGALGVKSALFVRWDRVAETLGLKDEAESIRTITRTSADGLAMPSEDDLARKEEATREFIKVCYDSTKGNREALERFAGENPAVVAWARHRVAQRQGVAVNDVAPDDQDVLFYLYIQSVAFAQLAALGSKGAGVVIPLTFRDRVFSETDLRQLAAASALLLARGFSIRLPYIDDRGVLDNMLSEQGLLIREITNRGAMNLAGRVLILVDTSKENAPLVEAMARRNGLRRMKPLVAGSEISKGETVSAVELDPSKEGVRTGETVSWFAARLKDIKADVYIVSLPNVPVPALGQTDSFDFFGLLAVIAGIVPAMGPVTAGQSWSRGRRAAQGIIREIEGADPRLRSLPDRVLTKLVGEYDSGNAGDGVSAARFIDAVLESSKDMPAPVRSAFEHIGAQAQEEKDIEGAQVLLAARAGGIVHELLAEALYRRYDERAKLDEKRLGLERARLKESLIALAVAVDGTADAPEKLPPLVAALPALAKAGIATGEQVRELFDRYDRGMRDRETTGQETFDALKAVDALYRSYKETGDEQLAAAITRPGSTGNNVIRYYLEGAGATVWRNEDLATVVAIYNALYIVAQVPGADRRGAKAMMHELQRHLAEAFARLPAGDPREWSEVERQSADEIRSAAILLAGLSVAADDPEILSTLVGSTDYQRKLLDQAAPAQSLLSPGMVLARFMILQQEGKPAAEVINEMKNTLTMLMHRSDTAVGPLAVAMGLYLDLLKADFSAPVLDDLRNAAPVSIDAIKRGILTAA